MVLSLFLEVCCTDALPIAPTYKYKVTLSKEREILRNTFIFPEKKSSRACTDALGGEFDEEDHPEENND